MKKITSVLLVLVLAMAVVLTGCGDKGGDDAKSDKAQVIKVGGTSAVIASMDPAVDWNGWYTVRVGVAENLFKLDENLEPTPWLAEGYEMVDDTTYKITLKEGVTFSNGEAMTPEKVIASLKRVGEMNVRAVALKDAEYSVDGNAVVIKTAEPYTILINDLCDPFAAIIDVDNTKDLVGNPIGTGPFVMSEFEPSVKAVMVKNEKYWGGEVKADKVEYNNIADFDTVALAVRNGELDIALDMSPEAADSIADVKEFDVTRTVQPRTYQMYFNMNTMKDKAVRQAIMYGIDKKTIGDVQLKGSVTPANSAFLENSAYSGKDLKSNDYDEVKAKELLKSAGYEDKNGDGIVEKDGKALKIKLSLYKRLAMESIATEMQAQLKKIGIDVEVATFEKATFFEPGDFDIGLYSIVTTPTGDPLPFLRGCMSEKGEANYGKYHNAEVEKALKELAVTFDKDTRVKLVNKIQQIAIDDAAFDYIGFNNMCTGISKDVIGYTTTPNDYYQVNKDLSKH